MKRVFLTLTLLFVFVIASNASFGQESVMLKYNFKEGKSFKILNANFIAYFP